ncbi:hypothetical protein ACCO45_002624 [Purpureocillium lilacinum]|uniref:Uncharacterized protein n=1 Tax=Purpureocillium lilacinum TaxID=33203 RepID=A0ACC4EAE0_PURLI
MSRSLQLKEEGNRHFQTGDYVGAESLYSQAILVDPKNPALFTNRAMARLKLQHWDSANYYLAQAQLAIRDYDAALESANKAHELCAATNDRSLAAVTGLVLRAKKERWESREKRRTREAVDLERELRELLQSRRDQLLASEPDEAEKDTIREETDAKAELLKDMFERARAQAGVRREVPEWAIDDISFGIMVDPVITKTGKSYERASIMEHLRRHPSDPLTREPLQPSELRPNLGLRQACDEFLEHNGWAVDY